MVTSCENRRQLILIDVNWRTSSWRQSSFLHLNWSQLTSTDVNWFDASIMMFFDAFDTFWRFLTFEKIEKKFWRKLTITQILSDANWRKLTSIETSIYVSLTSCLTRQVQLTSFDVIWRQLTSMKTQKWCMTLPLLYLGIWKIYLSLQSFVGTFYFILCFISVHFISVISFFVYFILLKKKWYLQFNSFPVYFIFFSILSYFIPSFFIIHIINFFLSEK